MQVELNKATFICQLTGHSHGGYWISLLGAQEINDKKQQRKGVEGVNSINYLDKAHNSSADHRSRKENPF